MTQGRAISTLIYTTRLISLKKNANARNVRATGRTVGQSRDASPRPSAPPFLNKKISSSTYAFLSAHLVPPALRRWPSQVQHATAFEAQRSDADPARPLQRATAAIPRCAFVS